MNELDDTTKRFLFGDDFDGSEFYSVEYERSQWVKHNGAEDRFGHPFVHQIHVEDYVVTRAGETKSEQFYGEYSSSGTRFGIRIEDFQSGLSDHPYNDDYRCGRECGQTLRFRVTLIERTVEPGSRDATPTHRSPCTGWRLSTSSRDSLRRRTSNGATEPTGS